MVKRILSAVLLVAFLVGIGLTAGCANEPDIYVEEHEEENTSKVKERNLRVE